MTNDEEILDMRLRLTLVEEKLDALSELVLMQGKLIKFHIANPETKLPGLED
mgnify:FL=1